ncbi:MAG TPA: hypothetical protein VLG71_02120 [Candidatus Limnocylindria bacterium]|nr:hypothetical protein [Candidatus Limnocylindria bacterium]
MKLRTYLFFLALAVQLPVTAAIVTALQNAQKALTQSRADLVAGKQKVLQGKQDIQDGYWKVKHDVVDTMGKASDALQPTMCMLTGVKKYTDEMNDVLAGLIASIVIVPPLGVAGSIAASLLSGVPDIVNSLSNTLGSVDTTLKTVRGTINSANEKLNPNSLLSFVLFAEQNFKKVRALIDQNKDKLNQDFINKVGAITEQLDTMIQFSKTSATSMSESLDQGGVTRVATYVQGLTKAYADARIANFGKQIALKNDILNCPVLGDDPAIAQMLDAAMSLDKGKDTADVHPWLDTRENVARPIITLLSQVNPDAWTAVLSKGMPAVYQNFTLAAQKFDQAIAKIDQTVGAFQTIIDRLQKRK